MQTVDLIKVNGTPMFAVRSDDPRFNRVHGHNFIKEGRYFIFPAYAPFGPIVLQDLAKVVPGFQLTAAAQAQKEHLESIPALIEGRVFPEGFEFHSKPFEHQIEGVAQLYYHPRFALFWDPGVGKTKTLIDLIRLLKLTEGSRALVLGPRVVVRNWAAEAAKHAGTDLRVGVMVGDTARKRKVISGYKDYDVIVCSYGTARTLGLPRLSKKTLQLILDARDAGRQIAVSGVKVLANGVRKLANPERQAAHVLAWAFGMPAAQVIEHAKAESDANPQWLEDVDYQVIVADESHGIKELASQQTKTVLALSKKAGRRYLMTGTPALGKPDDLYPQMRFLSPSIFPEDWMAFQDTFMVRNPRMRQVIIGFKNLNILNTRVQRVSVRKRKDECLDLPPRMVIDVPFDLTEEQKSLYNTLVSNMGAELDAFFEDSGAKSMEVQNAAVLLNKLGQISSGFVMNTDRDAELCNGCPHLARCVTEGIRPYTRDCRVATKPPPRELRYFKENPKLDLIEDMVKEILESETNKVIIWGVHIAELDAIQALLEKMKVGLVRVDGSSGSNTQKLIDRFNTDPTTRVYLSQISTGVGITLNAATYMIYSSVSWSLADYLQSIDRNYRAGQTEKVTVYRLVGTGTVDEYKFKALDQKKDISATLTNKLACTTCPKRFDCLKAGIELFDPGCIHQRSTKRIVAKAGVI